MDLLSTFAAQTVASDRKTMVLDTIIPRLCPSEERTHKVLASIRVHPGPSETTVRRKSLSDLGLLLGAAVRRAHGGGGWSVALGQLVVEHEQAMATRDPDYPYEIEFYEEPETGRMPVYEWILELDPPLRGALGTAMREVLQRHGIAVCHGEWGKQLGDGVFEFRVRHSAEETVRMFTGRKPRKEPVPDKVALRVFGHAHGEKLLLLLAGYDKAAEPSDRREDREIELARKRLTEYRRRRHSS